MKFLLVLVNLLKMFLPGHSHKSETVQTHFDPEFRIKVIDTTVSGIIIKIVDGDTYDLLLENKTTIRIRMNGIDAPEKGQAFYQKAKDFLGALCFQKMIKVIIASRDRYGRSVAESFTDDSRNLSYEMVKNGFAWQFKKYSKDQELTKLEDSARDQKLGLWADAHPIEPARFRAEKKNRND